MPIFASFASRSLLSNQAVLDPISNNVQLPRRHQLSTRYGRFLNNILPRSLRGSVEGSNAISSRVGHSSHISSLAVATLIGLSDAQRISPLVEAANASLERVIAIGRNSQFVLVHVLNHDTLSSRTVDQPPPSPGGTQTSETHNYSSSDRLDDTPVPIPSLDFPPSVEDRPIDVTVGPATSVAVAESNISSSSVDPSRNRVSFILPTHGSDESNPPLGNIGINNSINNPSIPPHMRPYRRTPGRTSSTSSSVTYNRRFPANLPNRSASSLQTTSTYVTAPTGASPPPSLRSFPRCESPDALLDLYRRIRTHSFQASSLRESMAFSDFTHEHVGIRDDPHGTTVPNKPPSVHDVSHTSSSSRKLLIIGNSYKACDERIRNMFSAETLHGVYEDRDRLTRVFKDRRYSVETLFEECFDRECALTRVARFLDDARDGDVRAIVFTGHGYRDPNGIASLVPPKSSENGDIITYLEWDQNIRNHTRPGVVVLSIMAHCFSGQVMKQDFEHQHWETIAARDGIEEGPTYLTFAASSQEAYESWVTHEPGSDSNRQVDHFIHALTSAIHSTDISAGTWSNFFKAFDWYFQRARSCASWQDKQVPPSSPNWRLINSQNPSFTASRLVRPSVVF